MGKLFLATRGLSARCVKAILEEWQARILC
jgi:hypothetical protein